MHRDRFLTPSLIPWIQLCLESDSSVTWDNEFPLWLKLIKIEFFHLQMKKSWLIYKVIIQKTFSKLGNECYIRNLWEKKKKKAFPLFKFSPFFFFSTQRLFSLVKWHRLNNKERYDHLIPHPLCQGLHTTPEGKYHPIEKSSQRCFQILFFHELCCCGSWAIHKSNTDTASCGCVLSYEGKCRKREYLVMHLNSGTIKIRMKHLVQAVT